MTIRDEFEPATFGAAGGFGEAEIVVLDPRFYRRIVLGGSLGFAESWMAEEWVTPSLNDVLSFFTRNFKAVQQSERILGRAGKALARWAHRRARNTRGGSRRNIHAHYDLGNDFFELFLDETMNYSCGVFEAPESTLHEASIAKMDRICRKLALSPSDHVIEIGTGWGGFAIYAATRYGCRVTTTTISQQQYEYASRRIAEAGLSDRITLLRKDYRELQGRYDKLVSVEMIEAVGYAYFDTYFRKCGELLKPDGVMALQAIVMPEQRYREYLRSADFIQRYVFPGGCLPSVGAMLQSLGRSTDMHVLEICDFSDHYARTLSEWKRNCAARLSDIRRLGYDERFLRLWEYYLSYCEVAFLQRQVGLVQFIAGKPGCRLDLQQDGIGR